MAADLACISFNCNSEPSDIITQNVSGILIESEDKRTALGREASKITMGLNLDKVMSRWEKL
jgi:hypothetical protein